MFKISKSLLLIILIALIIRIIIFFIIKPYSEQGFHLLFDKSDSSEYYQLAIDMVNNGSYGINDDYLSTIRTPGYPLFISFFFFLFGNYIWIVILFQILLDVLLIIFINDFTIKIWSTSAGLLASFLWAIEPFAVIYSNAFLSDSLFTFTIFLSFYYYLIFLENKELSCLILQALFLGSAALIRPIAIYLIPVFLILYIIQPKGLSFQNKIRYLLTFSFVISMLIGGWILRNEIVYKHFFFQHQGIIII